MAKKGKLTDKQQRFVEEYLIDLNATQAAIRAGYSAKTANEQGARHISKMLVFNRLSVNAWLNRSKRTGVNRTGLYWNCKDRIRENDGCSRQQWQDPGGCRAG